MAPKILVAGVGNFFLGDDGFGPAVVRSLGAEGDLPDGVRVADYGIRGMHLAHDLLAGYDALILVDALPARLARVPDDGLPARAARSGEVVVLEVTARDLGDGEFDAHGMDPAAMLAGLGRLGGTLPPTYVVGCPAGPAAEGIGLSEPVAAAVPGAVAAIRTLVARLADPHAGRC